MQRTKVNLVTGEITLVDLTQEEEAEAAAAFTAWTNDPVRLAKLADDADMSAARAHVKLHALSIMTPAQVQAWVSANVTNLAQAQDAISTLAVAVSILARRL